MQDRDWHRTGHRRKRKLYWNERSGEMEFDRARTGRRWRWPYQLRVDLPWWARELVRQALFWGAIALLYLIWTRFRA